MQRDSSVILWLGTIERMVMARGKFLSSWEKTGGLGVVALKTGELAADNNLAGYLQVAERVEETGKARLAGKYNSAASERYPSSESVLFGLANTMYAQRRYTVVTVS